MKIYYNDLKDGEEYYVYSLEFARGSYKVTRKIIPQKAKFTKKSKSSRGDFSNLKGKHLGDTWYTTFNVYDNLEEAVQEWNRELQEVLDKIISEHESRVKYIESLKYGNI